ncbi:MAG TPA: hypothetical protein VE687_16170 [Stellaceae bacterium]|nr:hypothetical protein [Stellaceae bacterium]
MMRDDVPCKFPAVIDPELDESILDFGFVQSLELHPAMPAWRCDCRPADAL